MKKFISSLLAALMVVSVSVTAFAETTAYHDDQISITVSDSTSQQNATYTLNDIPTAATYYTVPVGAKFALTGDRSNLAQICRRVFTKQADGTYVSNWTADYRSEGFWDASADLAGKLVHIFAETSDENSRTMDAYFFVSGTSSAPATPAAPAAPTAPTTPAAPTAPTTPTPAAPAPTAPTTPATATFTSDTGAAVTLGTGASYQFKVTSLNGKKPTLAIPGKAFRVTANGNKGNDYFFKVTAVGKDGESAGVYINGSKTPNTVLTIGNLVKIDTGKNLTVKSGMTYQFKLTSSTKPAFVSGSPKAFTVMFKGHTGNDYFYQIKAVGKAGQGAGFYLNGAKTPVSIATIG